MRTTLTLEEELGRELHRIARHSGKSFKEVVNETIRKGLATGEKPAPGLPPFRVEPVASEFRAGLDVYRLNQVNDELEIEVLRRALAQHRATPSNP